MAEFEVDVDDLVLPHLPRLVSWPVWVVEVLMPPNGSWLSSVPPQTFREAAETARVYEVYKNAVRVRALPWRDWPPEAEEMVSNPDPGPVLGQMSQAKTRFERV